MGCTESSEKGVRREIKAQAPARPARLATRTGCGVSASPKQKDPVARAELESGDWSVSSEEDTHGETACSPITESESSESETVCNPMGLIDRMDSMDPLDRTTLFDSVGRMDPIDDATTDDDFLMTPLDSPAARLSAVAPPLGRPPLPPAAVDDHPGSFASSDMDTTDDVSETDVASFIALELEVGGGDDDEWVASFWGALASGRGCWEGGRLPPDEDPEVALWKTLTPVPMPAECEDEGSWLSVY